MKKLLLLGICGLFLLSCGGRVPTPKTAHRVITKYFQKYGKKYKESDFGKFPLERAEISDIRPLQKDLAEVEANTYLAGGTAYRVRVTFQKKTFGWTAVAWENLGGR